MTDKEYVALKEDFFSKPLFPLDNVTLMGSRCQHCGEVFFGKAIACQNCQGEELEDVPLSRQGTLYSYTVIRNAPPGGYQGPAPFEPFGAGLVELPEGIRILAPLAGRDVDSFEIGMRLELEIHEYCTDQSGRTVLAYRFGPVAPAKGE